MGNYIIHNGQLYHWGIKGQKWGVRRYQNKDGTLTPAGKKRYDDTPTNSKKSKYRTKLETRYMDQGMSREQSEKAANTKIRTQKILGAVAGVTVAAAAIYTIGHVTGANKVVARYAKEKISNLVKH